MQSVHGGNPIVPSVKSGRPQVRPLVPQLKQWNPDITNPDSQQNHVSSSIVENEFKNSDFYDRIKHEPMKTNKESGPE